MNKTAIASLWLMFCLMGTILMAASGWAAIPILLLLSGVALAGMGTNTIFAKSAARRKIRTTLTGSLDDWLHLSRTGWALLLFFNANGFLVAVGALLLH